MSEKMEDLAKTDSAIGLDDLEKQEVLEKKQDEILEKEQDKSLEQEEKSEELDARGERVKAVLRRKKLDEMASKYMDTFYDGYNKRIKEVDENIKQEVAKKPNIIKRFFGFIKRLFGGKNKDNIEVSKNVAPKNVGGVKKQMEITQEEIEKYGKEIELELQQAVERDRLKRWHTIEEIKKEQQSMEMKHKL